MPRFANYEIEALLGRGGMAEVYRARALEGPHAGWPVAIKRLIPARNADPLSVELFLSEGELSRHLRHPNVVEVYEAGSFAGTSYIAMELVEGRDLAQIMAKVREKGLLLPVDFACFLVASVAAGLHHAHEARGADGAPLGIVHCDISPSNVFISRNGEIKLGDFGVARANRGPEVDGAFGKLGYISPEQLRGDPVTPAADIFALGLVLYELLTGARAFPGDAPRAVLKAMRQPPRPPSALRAEIGAELDAAVLGALQPQLEQRTASAAALADQLRGSYDDRIGTPMAIAAVVRGLFEPPATAPQRTRATRTRGR